MSFKIELNLWFLKMSYDLPRTEQEVFNRLLRDLSSHRVLYESYQSEYAGEVVSSISLIRQKIEKELKELSSSSKLCEGLMSMSKVCANFLTEVKNISEKLLYDTELTRSNLKNGAITKGAGIWDDQIERMENYDRIGGPDLMTNKRINIMQIQPPRYQHMFLTAFGEFRGSFGMLVMAVAGRTDCVIPDNLKTLIPFKEFIQPTDT
jgi:hypothetical protein